VKLAHAAPYAAADPYPFTLAKLGNGTKLFESRGIPAMKSKALRQSDPGLLSEVPAGMDPGHYNVTEVIILTLTLILTLILTLTPNPHTLSL